MSIRRAIGQLAVVALLLSACNTSSESTTTDEAGTTTTEGAPLVELPPFVAGDFEPEAEPMECLYLDGYVAVGTPQGNAQPLIDSLNAAGVGAVAVSADTVLVDTTDTDSVNGGYTETESLGDLIDGRMTVLDLNGGDDPLVVALYLQANGYAASPIHAVGSASHWNFKPGTNAEASQVTIVPPQDENGQAFDPARNSPVIGVVDSGMVEISEPWLERNGWVYYDDQDIEFTDSDNIASHGTFVATLIRQIAPTTAVSIARAHKVKTNVLVGRNGHSHPGPDSSSTQPYVTTELHVADALYRIMARGHPVPVGLNLSLGTYTCQPEEDAVLVTLAVGLEAWIQGMPVGSGTPLHPIFAAAGNEAHQPLRPFWPAAFGVATGGSGLIWDIEKMTDPPGGLFTDLVYGVGGIDQTGEEVVWYNPDGTQSVPPLPWDTRSWSRITAPGHDLIAVGDVQNQTFKWSGSSFATAVAAAIYSNGIQESPNFQATSVTYTEVLGLTYLDLSGKPVGPGAN